MEILFALSLYIYPFLTIRSLQDFAHAMAAQQLCHVQNFVIVTLLEQGSHRQASKNFNDFSMTFQDKNPKFPW